MPKPAVVTTDPSGEFSKTEFVGVDSSRYTVLLGSFLRPSLSVPGGPDFEWPLGTEGFTRSGSAALGVHKYIGDNAAVVDVMHNEEGRIEMTGLFPGKTGNDNMIELLTVLQWNTPKTGKLLSLPGLLKDVQHVVAESWNFAHAEGDWSNSIEYTASFVLVGTGPTLKVPKISLPGPNPTTRVSRGQAQHIFKVKDGARTLRAIAKLKYGKADLWTKIYSLNKPILTKFLKDNNLSLHQLPVRLLPLGLKLRY
jgi:hypothetical protein